MSAPRCRPRSSRPSSSKRVRRCLTPTYRFQRLSAHKDASTHSVDTGGSANFNAPIGRAFHKMPIGVFGAPVRAERQGMPAVGDRLDHRRILTTLSPAFVDPALDE